MLDAQMRIRPIHRPCVTNRERGREGEREKERERERERGREGGREGGRERVRERIVAETTLDIESHRTRTRA